ncbi:MAG: S-methyl-5-thioribose-1-phosphate isomerase [Caldilineales bacterium]|nr:S-methyl-5-thioribose-1-phosphate isomerase [Caldilineales bacterium]
MTTPRTIWWADGKVHMIDQRQLPQTVEIVDFDDVQGIALAINEMVVRGAPAIGAAAAFGMAVAAQGSPVADTATLLADLRQAKTVLDAARPTAVNLSWATSRFLQMAERLAGDGAMVNEIAKALLAEAEAFVAQDIEINQRMGRHGAEVIPQGANILHHCNTGSLATAGYGTALGVVRAAHVAGKHIHVWVDETRPRLQGARLTAWELMLEDIPMHLVVDSASGLLMRQGKVDVVLFGADRVAANGDVANKIGSYNLAILAQEHGIPCYAVVPTSTIEPTLADGDQIPIEERSWLEVATLAGVPVAPNDVLVYNPAFDITPHRYLTGIITEEGICYPPFEQSLKHAKLRAEGRDS